MWKPQLTCIQYGEPRARVGFQKCQSQYQPLPKVVPQSAARKRLCRSSGNSLAINDLRKASGPAKGDQRLDGSQSRREQFGLVSRSAAFVTWLNIERSPGMVTTPEDRWRMRWYRNPRMVAHRYPPTRHHLPQQRPSQIER